MEDKIRPIIHLIFYVVGSLCFLIGSILSIIATFKK